MATTNPPRIRFAVFVDSDGELLHVLSARKQTSDAICSAFAGQSTPLFRLRGNLYRCVNVVCNSQSRCVKFVLSMTTANEIWRSIHPQKELPE